MLKSRHRTGLSQTFMVLPVSTAMEFTVSGFNLADNGNGPPDAFEAALLNSNTLALLVGPATGLTRRTPS